MDTAIAAEVVETGASGRRPPGKKQLRFPELLTLKEELFVEAYTGSAAGRGPVTGAHARVG